MKSVNEVEQVEGSEQEETAGELSESGLTTVKATKKINGENKETVVLVDLGKDVQDAIEKFGADVVFDNFRRSATITAQAAMRRCLEAGLDQAGIEAKMASFKPGVAMERVIDPVAALKAKIAKMTPEEKAALFAELGA